MQEISPRAASARSRIESSIVAPLAFGRKGGETLICFSHLRWNFVFQRPQHLMVRFAKDHQVIFFEEPAPAEGDTARLDLSLDEASQVLVATPRLPNGLHDDARDVALRDLLFTFVTERNIEAPILWYYTPMMLGFSSWLADDAAAVLYDCMDELSNFKFAPERLKTLERELVARADVVFTGGYSLYEAKRGWHANIHPFPSSVDVPHFAKARCNVAEPSDQKGIPKPRLGFYGVIDERMDLDLLAKLADAHPEWSIVMVGPVVKVDPADLPRRANIHYLGGKDYEQLPAYLAGWDVALMPFAINDSTRFISPTKTPEYLAGGRPVVSTAIVDVRRHYGDLDGVIVADTHEAFIAGCERALALGHSGTAWLQPVDAVLADLSWDKTQMQMSRLVDEALVRRFQAQVKAADPAPAIQPAGRKSHYDALIVGAGFAGSILAERMASAGKRVMLVDRRPHIGGNAYDMFDEAGVLMHKYGPHIFHTNSEEIVRYLSRFTTWRPYEHRVLGSVDGKLVPIPINRTTINALYGLDLTTDEQAADFLASRAEPVDKIRTSEDVVVSAIGRELYEKFFQGYTRKQWGVDPSDLDKSVTARVPTRTNTDDRYFTDTFQVMPKNGYTAMFENMLDRDGVTIQTAVDFEDVRDDVLYDRLIFTGPVDEFFSHRYGALPYRSLRFEHQTLNQEQFQETGTVNYPSPETPYTRISEYKHLTGQKHAKTTITYEYPSAVGDPYYPIPRAENQALYKKYEALAQARPDVSFVGRLATYRYYNMDQVAGQALATYRRLAERESGFVSSRDVLGIAVNG